MKNNRLVLGFGVNDVTYNISKSECINGVKKTVWTCPYYADWRSLLERCYCNKLHQKHPSYIGCTVDPEWLILSNFIKWVDSQPNKNWQNCELDKDLLVEGNKHYGPDNAVYIPSNLNLFIINRSIGRGTHMVGVCYKQNKSRDNPYESYCKNPFTKKQEYLGLFPTELEAHKAWQAKKHEYACLLAEQQQDPRVAKALRERYAPDKDWSNK